MSSKQMRDLRELNDKELLIRLTEIDRELIRLKGQHFQGELDNPMLLRNARKEKARIHTLLRLRQDRKVKS